MDESNAVNEPQRKPLTFADVMQTMRNRFTSGNGIPVERATIKPDEWGLVLAELSRRAVHGVRP
jgi:lipoate-protein ligase A